MVGLLLLLLLQARISNCTLPLPSGHEQKQTKKSHHFCIIKENMVTWNAALFFRIFTD